MPSTAYAPIRVVRGESLAHIAFLLFEPPTDTLAEPTEPRDLTGCTATLVIYTDKTCTTAVLSLSSGAGTLVITPLSGSIVPDVSVVTLDALTRGVYWYRIIVTFADGEPEETHAGEFDLAS